MTHRNRVVKSWQVMGEPFEIDAKYKVTDYLGSGAYGMVCAVHDFEDNSNVAIKKCKKIYQSRTLAKRTLREMRLLRQFNHENIVKLKSIILPTDLRYYSDLYLVFEIMDTDLAQIIRSPQPLKEQHTQYFAYQLLRALEYLHSQHIVHRDIKPRNILINADCTLKVADFGLARMYNPEGPESVVAITDYVTTRWYRAPEVIVGWSRYSSAIDMWAVGCIIAELLSRAPLFPGENTMKQLGLIIRVMGSPSDNFILRSQKSLFRQYMMTMLNRRATELSLLVPTASPQAIDIIRRLLDYDPSRRPSATQCLAHPFIAGMSTSLSPPVCSPMCIAPEEFEFEQRKLTIEDLRAEVALEIAYYNEELVEQLVMNTLEDPPTPFPSPPHHHSSRRATAGAGTEAAYAHEDVDDEIDIPADVSSSGAEGKIPKLRSASSLPSAAAGARHSQNARYTAASTSTTASATGAAAGAGRHRSTKSYGDARDSAYNTLPAPPAPPPPPPPLPPSERTVEQGGTHSQQQQKGPPGATSRTGQHQQSEGKGSMEQRAPSNPRSNQHRHSNSSHNRSHHQHSQSYAGYSQKAAQVVAAQQHQQRPQQQRQQRTIHRSDVLSGIKSSTTNCIKAGGKAGAAEAAVFDTWCTDEEEQELKREIDAMLRGSDRSDSSEVPPPPPPPPSSLPPLPQACSGGDGGSSSSTAAVPVPLGCLWTEVQDVKVCDVTPQMPNTNTNTNNSSGSTDTAAAAGGGYYNTHNAGSTGVEPDYSYSDNLGSAIHQREEHLMDSAGSVAAGDIESTNASSALYESMQSKCSAEATASAECGDEEEGADVADSAAVPVGGETVSTVGSVGSAEQQQQQRVAAWQRSRSRTFSGGMYSTFASASTSSTATSAASAHRRSATDASTPVPNVPMPSPPGHRSTVSTSAALSAGGRSSRVRSNTTMTGEQGGYFTCFRDPDYRDVGSNSNSSSAVTSSRLYNIGGAGAGAGGTRGGVQYRRVLRASADEEEGKVENEYEECDYVQAAKQPSGQQQQGGFADRRNVWDSIANSCTIS